MCAECFPHLASFFFLDFSGRSFNSTLFVALLIYFFIWQTSAGLFNQRSLRPVFHGRHLQHSQFGFVLVHQLFDQIRIKRPGNLRRPLTSYTIYIKTVLPERGSRALNFRGNPGQKQFPKSVALEPTLMTFRLNPVHRTLSRGSQQGGGFYGYRLKFWLFYGYG